MKGFFSNETLILGIVFIVGVFVLIFINPVRKYEMVQDNMRVDDLEEIRSAVENYYHEYGEYPASSESNEIVNERGQTVEWGTRWDPYFDRLPADPDRDRQYLYFSDGQSYRLYASLTYPEEFENACAGSCGRLREGETCGLLACNYGLSSPNTSF